MALVAYENSDSEYEDDTEDNTTVVTLNTNVEVPLKPDSKQVTAEENPATLNSDSGQNLFNLLPQPTNKKPVTIEEDDEFLHKKESTNITKPKAKIMVPSLDDFKDVDHVAPSVKSKTANGKKSGLLSILPQPKNAALTTKATTKTLIPHVLTKKPDTTAKKKDPLPSPMKKAKTVTKLLAEYSDDSDNDDEIQNDFFSINKPVELPPVEDIPLDIDVKPKAVKTVPTTIPTNHRQVQNIQSYFKQDADEEMNGVAGGSEYGSEASSSSYSSHEVVESQSNGDVVLDDEAIMKLCGARGKRKREEIQIVNVNQQEVLADAKEWLLKGLMDDTSKRVSASKKRGNEPTHQQKRKHQITYLAHQAKANEVELQNQWANNRMSKRQTQSKYGF